MAPLNQFSKAKIIIRLRQKVKNAGVVSSATLNSPDPAQNSSIPPQSPSSPPHLPWLEHPTSSLTASTQAENHHKHPPKISCRRPFSTIFTCNDPRASSSEFELSSFRRPPPNFSDLPLVSPASTIPIPRESD